MADFLGLNRAVPGSSLLDRDDPASLGFETTSWKHLNCYVAKVEDLPAGFDASTASAGALAKVRSVVDDFGSPKQLRKLIQSCPDTLTADQPPKTLYASAAWVVAHLRRSASSVVATLQEFSSSGGSVGDVKEALRHLGGDAENARKAIGPMVEALKRLKTAILDANAALAAAYADDTDTLQQVQEDVGRFTVKVDTLQKEVAQLGFFSAGKKQELDLELAALHRQKDEISNRSEKLRSALAIVEPIQNEGFWLESGMDDLVGFLDKLRQVLTTFGSAMTQIAADGSDAQLQDAARMDSILGTEAAIGQWSAIDKAAQRFLIQAMVDFPTPNDAARGQP
jgi:chaperonin cofactor prefoldin